MKKPNVIANLVLKMWQSIPSGSPRRILLAMTAVLVVILAYAGIHPHSTLAASSTPSATSTASATPSETLDIQEKIKTLVKENLSATESNLKEKINLKTLVGYVGTINSINSGNITIDSKDGTLVQITTETKTTYTKSGAASKLSSLALSDKIIVIGTLIKDDIILAKKISVVVEEPNPVVSGTVVAKISSLDLKKKIIGLSVDDKEVLYSLTKKSTIKLDELQVGQTIFAITKKYDGKDLLSRAKVI